MQALAVTVALVTGCGCGSPAPGAHEASTPTVVEAPTPSSESSTSDRVLAADPEEPPVAEAPVETPAEEPVAEVEPPLVIEEEPEPEPAPRIVRGARPEVRSIESIERPIPDDPAWAFFTHRDAPIRRALRSQPIVGVERGRGGRSLGFKLTFEDGSQAYFKPDQEFNGMSWNAEIAAYYLDRMLGLGRTAPVTSRQIAWSELEEAAGRDYRVDELHMDEEGVLTGAVIWWVPERLAAVELPAGWQRWLLIDSNPPAVTPFQRPGHYRRALTAHREGAEGERMPSEAPSPDTEGRPAELSDLIVFDYLTNNVDRWGGNNTNIRTVGRGGRLMFLDNAAGFTLRRPTNSTMDRRLAQVQRFRRSTIRAIRSFDIEEYAARLANDANGPILDQTHLRNLEIRRLRLLEHVDQLVAQHGADAVYAW